MSSWHHGTIRIGLFDGQPADRTPHASLTSFTNATQASAGALLASSTEGVEVVADVAGETLVVLGVGAADRCELDALAVADGEALFAAETPVAVIAEVAVQAAPLALLGLFVEEVFGQTTVTHRGHVRCRRRCEGSVAHRTLRAQRVQGRTRDTTTIGVVQGVALVAPRTPVLLSVETRAVRLSDQRALRGLRVSVVVRTAVVAHCAVGETVLAVQWAELAPAAEFVGTVTRLTHGAGFLHSQSGVGHCAVFAVRQSAQDTVNNCVVVHQDWGSVVQSFLGSVASVAGYAIAESITNRTSRLARILLFGRRIVAFACFEADTVVQTWSLTVSAVCFTRGASIFTR